MHDKPRKSRELLVLQSLLPRMKLSLEEKQHVDNLEKGYNGEMAFYQQLNKTPLKNQIILYDLLLPSNKTEFQLDSLFIEKNKIYLFEIKNYEGDFYIQQDNWYVASNGKEIRNPLSQLKRSEFSLRQLLHKWGYTISIEPYVIFINPEFTLYQAPLHQPIIFPTQLNRFLKKLLASNLEITQNQKSLSEKFATHHIENSSYEQLPEYEYDQLRKGMTCSCCKNFLTVKTFHILLCEHCYREIKAETAVIEHIAEFHLLFPERKITTKSIYEWCGGILSKKIIRRILTENFIFIDRGGFSYYLLKK
ncbi:nuclease-related domain-containing protein [Bacillus sp. SD088]|uniref:nuclease-related domain-containing protein n=1 Tax=Bacillus sp. SD088 TaxID=2782012 RepID=UPI001A95E075|nr:nuclease-related domain-containing protein [Bacillus sp. SD088]MBO0993339.1 NERD domain-containing protein [Bacillus sp. SD088]